MQSEWSDYKLTKLIPSIKASANYHSLNPHIKITSYIPSMEKLFASAIELFQTKHFPSAWLKFMRCATFILEELRKHPKWSTLSTKETNRLMTVLATRSVTYAETCEKHMQMEFHTARKQAKEAKEAAAEVKKKATEETKEANAQTTYRTSISMYVNGEKCQVPEDIDPHSRLVDYLRDTLGKTGTKIGCGEGGCGACSVLLSFESDTDTTPTHRVINSCLRSIASCDGAYITTVEGIGAKGANKTMHPTQERLAQCNGSQCGYCSPGWVMNAYSMLMNDPSPTSVQNVQDRFDGNLCRCTGFRSILKAMSSFVPSEEKKDLNTGDKLAPYDAKQQQAIANLPLPVDISPQQLDTPLKLESVGPNATWYAPTSVTELNTVLQPLVTSKDNFEFVLGGTSRGVKKYYNGVVDGTSSGNTPDTYISLFRVKELHAMTLTNGNVTVGSAVTLSELIEMLQKDTNDSMHAQLARHLSRVANLQVRNVGGWAGNLCMSKKFPTFPSDVLTTLSTAGATVQIQRWTTTTDKTAAATSITTDTTAPPPLTPTVEHLTVAAWAIEKQDASFVDVLMSLTIPSSNTTLSLSSTTAPHISFTTYKLARRQQNAHAILNLGCCLKMDPIENTVMSATIYLHGDDKSSLTHATSCADALLGQDITKQTTLNVAIVALVEKDLNNGRSTYILAAAQSLLYKSILAAQPSSSLNPALISATNWQLPRGVSTGTEVWSPPDPSKEAPPAGTGCTKLRAPLQCTGQAKYTSDFTAGKTTNLLHAVAVQSTRALATVTGIDATVATQFDGVMAVITAKDIDTSIGMINDCGIEAGDNGNASPEQIFVPINGTVYSTGQTIALVVAKTRAAAKKAAIAMMDPSTKGVTFAPETKNDPRPILTLDDAIAQNSFYQGSHCALLERLQPNITSIDAAVAACAHSWKGTVRLGGQRHFYMETQRSVVTPTEAEGLHVRSSTQGVTVVAKMIAKVTGLQTHNVICEQTRAGGGFGGKLTRNLPIACAAAVAARSLDAPVSYVLDRVEDQKTTGAREPMRMDIEIGFDAAGKVNAFKLCLFIDAGWTIDGSFGDLDMATYWSDNAYNIPNFHCESKACKTNKPTCTSMRAPGLVHSITAIETAMDHVASTLNMDPNDVRALNFVQVGDVTPYLQTLKYVSLNKCWTKVMEQYKTLKTECDTFNMGNRWVKRAVAMNPSKYGIGWDATFSGANVSIYGRDGSIVVSHGGAEIGQGLFTKVAQAAATALGLTDPKDFDLIRMGDTSNLMVPNNGMTGGSSTSEVTCKVVMNACAVLVERLKPYRDPISAGGKGLNWRDAVTAAWSDHIQLSAQGWFAPKAAVPGLAFSFKYYVYAAALSVVELDVLTGQVQTLRSDIVYDCGTSLNPVIDIGQIEGAFVMGIGTWLTEEAVHDPMTGKLTTNGTWEYKPPCSKDIPLEFNVSLLKDNPNVEGILGSKATAEPPMILSNTVHFALRRCIELARLDNGLSKKEAGTFVMDVPATAERVVAAIGTVAANDFVLEL